MPALEPAAREYADFVGPADVRDDDLDKWKKAGLAEIKSIVTMMCGTSMTFLLVPIC